MPGMDTEQRAREIDRKIILVNIIDFPGAVLAGLGVYGRFSADGQAFLDILNDTTVTTAMIVIGAGIMIWGGVQTFRLAKQKAALSAAAATPARDPRVDP